MSILDERGDGAAKFEDCFFQFLAVRRVDQRTELTHALFGGGCHPVRIAESMKKCCTEFNVENLKASSVVGEC